jgi:hypothetical protein
MLEMCIEHEKWKPQFFKQIIQGYCSICVDEEVKRVVHIKQCTMKREKCTEYSEEWTV